MKKLITFLFFILPLFSFAQDENPPLFKDFAKGIKEITSTIVFNEHINIMQINWDNESFQVIAVNDQMQIVWSTPLKGFAMALKKFKGKIIAIAATEYSSLKGKGNTFKGYVLNPDNGSVILDKIIFDGSKEYVDVINILSSNDNFWGISVRQTGFERRIHVGLPVIFVLISIKGYEREYMQTRSFEVISFDEQLNAATAFKPLTLDAPFLGAQVNNKGDVFVEWLNNGGNINVYKYSQGKSAPVGQATSEIALKNDNFMLSPNVDHIRFLPSSVNSDVLYYSLAYDNSDNKKELGVGSFDFSSGKKQFTIETFEKDHVKNLVKAFTVVNTKLDKPDMGNLKDMDICYFNEVNGTVVAACNAVTVIFSNNGSYSQQGSVLINQYDAYLSLKHQQFLPSSGGSVQRDLPIGFHMTNNKLYAVASDRRHITVQHPLYGVLDLSTGQWDKMYWLSKKKIDNSDYANAIVGLWYDKTFILPHMSPTGIIVKKFDVTLQQNSY